jgi:flagellar biosynthesis/type III secretory pathway chaperone
VKTIIKVLKETLRQETGVYRRYLETAEDDRQCIMHARLDGLEKNTRAKEEFVAMLEEYEEKRLLLTAELADRLKLPAASVKLAQIAEYLDPEERTELLNLRQELFNLLDRVKHANRVNEMIVKGSLTYLEKTINLFAGGDGRETQYTKAGVPGKGAKKPLRLSYVA